MKVITILCCAILLASSACTSAYSMDSSSTSVSTHTTTMIEDFWSAINTDEPEELAKLLFKNPNLIFCKHDCDMTPFHFAAYKGHPLCLAVLIDRCPFECFQSFFYVLDEDGQDPYLAAYAGTCELEDYEVRKKQKYDAIFLMLKHYRTAKNVAQFLLKKNGFNI